MKFRPFKSRFNEMFESFLSDEECVSLESLCDTFRDGDWIESKDQDASGIRLIQTGNIGISTYLDKVEKARYINEDSFKRLNGFILPASWTFNHNYKDNKKQ